MVQKVLQVRLCGRPRQLRHVDRDPPRLPNLVMISPMTSGGAVVFILLGRTPKNGAPVICA